MKTNAPEKIYLLKSQNRMLDGWYNELPSPKTFEQVEYVRTDAFIEKACEWIEILPSRGEKDVDFEEELKHYCNDYYNCDYPKQLEEETCSEVMPHIVSAAKHFFELGMAVSNKAQKGEEV